MQVTEVANEGLKRAFSVVVPATDITAEREKRLAKLGKELRLPGFRPGKVPPRVVQQRYGQAVMGEVLESSVNDATQRVVSDRGLRPAQQPKIELVNFADGTDLEFKVEMEVMPEVPMPDFAGIELERLKAEPGEEQIEKTLASIAQRNRKLEDITEDRPAERGEMAVCDFVGRLVGEGGEVEDEPFPGGSATDMPIEVGGEGFIPGFTEQLVGIRAGRDPFRRRDLPGRVRGGGAGRQGGALRGDVQGAEASGAARDGRRLCREPRLRGRGEAPGHGARDLAARVRRDGADADQARAARQPCRAGGLPGAAGHGGRRSSTQIWQRVEADMKAGRLDEDDKGKDEETLRADYRAIAERRIRLGLLLSEIGRTNNITVSGEELARAMRQEAGRYPGQEQQVMEFFRKNPQAAENLRSPIFEEKVVDFMLELAKVSERSVAPEELATAATAAA